MAILEFFTLLGIIVLGVILGIVITVRVTIAVIFKGKFIEKIKESIGGGFSSADIPFPPFTHQDKEYYKQKAQTIVNLRNQKFITLEAMNFYMNCINLMLYESFGQVGQFVADGDAFNVSEVIFFPMGEEKKQ